MGTIQNILRIGQVIFHPFLSGSIWPAVILHFAINAMVAVQGLAVPMIEPDILAYRRLLWLSIPLGLLGLGLLVQTALRPIVPEVPYHQGIGFLAAR